MTDFKDRILGAIFGHALGDAVGRTTKFAKECASVNFPNGGPINGRDPNSWSDRTDTMTIVMLSLINKNMKFDALDIAKRLSEWNTNSEKVFGPNPNKILAVTIKNEKFTSNPLEVAKEMWLSSNKNLATNDCIVRTTIVGTLGTEVEAIAMNLSAITHYDPRCICAGALHSLIINDIIYRNRNAISILQDNIATIRKHMCPGYIDDEETGKLIDNELGMWTKIACTEPISQLELGSVNKTNYVFKGLACGIYALRVIDYANKHEKCLSFKKTITHIAMQRGDADANCAIAGSVLGAHMGYSKLPQDWIDAMPEKVWLMDRICQFIEKLSL